MVAFEDDHCGKLDRLTDQGMMVPLMVVCPSDAYCSTFSGSTMQERRFDERNFARQVKFVASKDEDLASLFFKRFQKSETEQLGSTSLFWDNYKYRFQVLISR